MKKNINKIKFLALITSAVWLVFIGLLLSSDVLAEAADTATLKVVVNVNNDNGGTNNPNDFIITVSGANANPGNFSGSSTGTDVAVNAGQNFSVSAATLSYSAELSPDCTSSLTVGSQAVCTITLNDLPRLTDGQSPPNLIKNASVEIVNGSNPDLWQQAGFGNNNRQFSYPVAGVGNGSAVKVTISNYVDGDAKWLFADVPVIPGHIYTYSDNYISDINSELAAEYFDVNHNHLSYEGFTSVSPFSQTEGSYWGSASASFIPPSNAAYMTVYHLIKSNGSLTTDNFSLTEVPLPQPFSKGFVSLTFDDGSLSQYINAFPKLVAAGIKGTFYIPTHATSGLSIKNQSLENGDTAPVNWNNSGSLNAVYIYPVPGHNSDRAAMVSSTEENSNAAWYFDPVVTLNDSIYSFDGWYKSTTSSELVAKVTTTSGSVIETDVVDASGVTLGTSVNLPSSNNDWSEVKANFYIPVNAKNVTVLIRLKGIGDLTIDDFALGGLNYMNASQIKSLLLAGQEIGGHSQSHKDLTSLSLADAQDEINGGRNDLLSNGLSPILSFDYPFGIFNQSIKNIVQQSGYSSGRSIVPGFNGKQTDKFSLFVESVNSTTPLSTVVSWINQTVNDKTWLILVFHDIESNLSQTPYGTTPENLDSIINYLKNNNVATHTVSEGIDLMNSPDPKIDPTLENISITKFPNKLSYGIGESLDLTGLEVTGTYSDNSTKVETVTVSDVTGFNSGAPASGQILTITLNGKTATYAIDVVVPAVTLNSINITHPASKLVYYVGDALDLSGLEVTGTYSDNSTKIENITTEDITGFNSSTPVVGQVLTITLNGKTTTYTVDINAKITGGGGGGGEGGRGVPIFFNKIKEAVKDKVIKKEEIKEQIKQKVLGAEKFKFNKNLRYKMSSDSVKELQKRLKNEGLYEGPITGYFGPLTLKVVKKFQTKNGLPSTGFVGDLTRKILNESEA